MSDQVSENVRSNLARLRDKEHLDLSLQDIADRLTELGWPVARSLVGKIENGKRRVEVGEAILLARALRVPLSWLAVPWDGKDVAVGGMTISGVILRTTPLDARPRERRRLYAAAPAWVVPASDQSATVGELAERVMAAQDRADDARSELLDAVDALFGAPADPELLAAAEAAFARLRKAAGALGREQLGESKAIDTMTDGGS